jgi:putative transposase
MPKGVQPRARQRIHDMCMAETKEQALVAHEQFMALYEAESPKACRCLEKDRKALFAFYDFPAEHCRHIRTTNPIGSTFATVRHRTRRTKGCGTRTATLAMTCKLAREAEWHWRKVNGHKLIVKIFEGIKFKDGIEQPAIAAQPPSNRREPDGMPRTLIHNI